MNDYFVMFNWVFGILTSFFFALIALALVQEDDEWGLGMVISLAYLLVFSSAAISGVIYWASLG